VGRAFSKTGCVHRNVAEHRASVLAVALELRIALRTDILSGVRGGRAVRDATQDCKVVLGSCRVVRTRRLRVIATAPSERRAVLDVLRSVCEVQT
jgi:hypothetical protein